MQDTWQEVVQVIWEQVSRASFDTWIRNLEVTRENHNWTITTLNEFAKDWVERKYRPLIIDAIKQVTGDTPVVTITCKNMFSSGVTVESILREVHQLSLFEKDRLFDILKTEMNDEQPHAASPKTSISSADQKQDTDRMARLESEVIGLKNDLQLVKEKIGHHFI